MKMLLYAGASDEDIKLKKPRPRYALRLRSNGQEVQVEELVGKTIKVVNVSKVLGLMIEVVEEN